MSALLDSLGLTRETVARLAPAPPTRQERILEAKIKGASTAQIAAEEGISEQAVRYRVNGRTLPQRNVGRLACPHCGVIALHFVTDSRGERDGSAILRKRDCAGCGERFTTMERVGV